MKLVYIAGPYRGPNEWAVVGNIRAAEALAVEVWQAGAVAVCPHKNSGLMAGIVPDDVFLAGDLEILRRRDAVVVTANWQASEGARGEVREAEQLGLPVFDTVAKLVAWLGGSAPRMARVPAGVGAV